MGSLVALISFFGVPPHGQRNLRALTAAKPAVGSKQSIGAVIVEPRLHEYLAHVITNAAETLAPEITIDLYHGPAMNVCDFSSALCDLTRSGRLRLFELERDELDACSYSQLLTTQKFWRERGATNKTLVFQTDSVLCKQSSYTVRLACPPPTASVIPPHPTLP